MKILKITTKEVKELQEVAKSTFFETFADINTKENMEKYLETSFNEEKLKEELDNPYSEFYLASTDVKTVGYLKLNYKSAQSELKDNNALEIERIYVLKEFHGKKVGKILLDKALEIAKKHNFTYVWLGVWENNNRAIRFYEKNGFVRFGTHIFKLGEEEQTDLIMKLVL